MENENPQSAIYNYPHIVRRATFGTSFLENEAFPIAAVNLSALQTEAASHRPVPSDKLTAEVALFFDEAGYKAFAPYMDNDDVKLRDMLLAYVNGVILHLLSSFVLKSINIL